MRAALPPLEEKSAENSESTSAGAGLGGSIVSKNILLGLGRLTWCLKENPAHELDNGWRFFSDIDDDEYLNDSNNLAVCDWSTVVEIEPAVLPIFDLPVGADLCLMQEDDNKFFVDNKTGLKLSFAEFKN
ncbi:DUF2185 domain-containing protein [Mobiluncus holmesii]|uniref:DUF2185 domain-containing protein n=2 Tax=Mobiluncus porci TaxID=2652278 RepID=A0A7K0K0J7_9ACTO|nr:DUF2185 domain-containing protein [Mobiluncus porci]